MRFNIGDMVVSTRNRRLTYKILEVGLLNDLGEPDYRVEIFVDGKSGLKIGGKVKEEHKIHNISCSKMDEWGELLQAGKNSDSVI